jgi:uncharacterized membrane protein HdeD (DUF308 family)
MDPTSLLEYVAMRPIVVHVSRHHVLRTKYTGHSTGRSIYFVRSTWPVAVTPRLGAGTHVPSIPHERAPPVTQTTTAPATTSVASTRSGLRSLYLIRIAFSVIWVALVFATSHSLKSGDAPSLVAAVLLVAYPLWDAIATVLELRTTGSRTSLDRVRVANVVLSSVAAAAMLIAVFSTIRATLVVFGAWALISGAIQLALAIRRRRSVGAQWPMMLSGGISVLAGINFAATSRSASSGLSSVAGYSAFGAFWFLVAVLALRRSRAIDPSAPDLRS